MLTDTALKALKPQEKKYKVTDRDGMYVLVMPTGAITFRYDYRLNGRRETLIIGRYGRAGVSLARAREKLIDAQRAIQEGRSPAQEKQRDKRRLKEAKSFGEFGERWFQEARMADSTKAMRRAIFERDCEAHFWLCDPAWGEGRQPGRGGWTGVDRDLCPERSLFVAVRDPRHARAAGARPYAADNPAWDEADPDHHGPQKRVARRCLG